VKRFEKSFLRQQPIPAPGVERVNELLHSGRLHRYDLDPGEAGDVGLLEQEFASYLGVPYCLACASGGYAIHLALSAAQVQRGEPVLTNAFTLAPVPGAIHNAGAEPVLVELADDYCIDLDDLEGKAAESSARVLLLSHMRGHIVDMDRVLDICQQYELLLIEDCAHTMGGHWHGRASGSDADIACFSTQTYKHLNSGEGGLLTTRHDEIMARAVILSGSYMLYQHQGAGPPEEAYEDIRLQTPNYSGRMDNLRAAVLRPQLATLDERCQRWNQLYGCLEQGLRALPRVRIPARNPLEGHVASSIQFSLPGLSGQTITDVVNECEERGVSIKWFGADQPQGYTSRYDSWQYMKTIPRLEKTEAVLATLCDMRIPLTFDEDDCALIVEIVGDVLKEIEEVQ
jgi:dTDP-4-amino-4,6-dideoxygalactose transaminase